MPVSPMREPTERSMPAVTMTAVMPRAMIPKNAKFRVTLYMFRSVRNTSETTDMMIADDEDRDEHPERLSANERPDRRQLAPRELTASSMVAWPAGWPVVSFMRSRWLR